MGKKINTKCKRCGKDFTYYECLSFGKYCTRECSRLSPEKSAHRKGIKFSDEYRKKISEKMKEQYRTGIRKVHPGFAVANKKRPHLSGDKSPLWRGGLTPLRKKIRGSMEYRIWRESVFKRDDFKCVKCGISGSKSPLNADHIIPFSVLLREFAIGSIDYESLFDTDNGQTLCVPCHKQTSTYNSGAKRCIEKKWMDALESVQKKKHPSISFGEFYSKIMGNIIKNHENVISKYF